MQCWIFLDSNDSFGIIVDGNFTLIDVVVLRLVLCLKELSTTANVYSTSAVDNAVNLASCISM